MTDTTTPEPTTAQLVAAFGSALLPLAGPYGIAASGVLTAGLAFLQHINTAGDVVTMADLDAIAKMTGDNLDAFGKRVDALT